MRVLLTGGTGQLGRAMARTVPVGVELLTPGREALDLARPAQAGAVVGAYRPDVVVNAAAYTAVDRAESERDVAFAINGEAVASLARACAAAGIRLVQISTDFVFDGARGRPYLPDDEPNPIGVYGASKLAGERALVGTDGLDWRILRTAWVHAPWGRNFTLTMLRLLRERGEVSVVSDQVGTPTSVYTLADAAWRACSDPGAPARLHVTDAGVASWYDFALAIAEEAGSLGKLGGTWTVRPITTREYPTPARRPSYSVLACEGSVLRLGIQRPHWRTALRRVLEEVPA